MLPTTDLLVRFAQPTTCRISCLHVPNQRVLDGLGAALFVPCCAQLCQALSGHFCLCVPTHFVSTRSRSVSKSDQSRSRSKQEKKSRRSCLPPENLILIRGFDPSVYPVYCPSIKLGSDPTTSEGRPTNYGRNLRNGTIALVRPRGTHVQSHTRGHRTKIT